MYNKICLNAVFSGVYKFRYSNQYNTSRKQKKSIRRET